MSLPKGKHEPPGKRPILRVLKEGEGIGDVSVLGDRRWAGVFGVCADFIAMENCHVAFIETRDIQEALDLHPQLRRVKKYFESIAYKEKATIFEPERISDSNVKTTYLWINLSRQALLHSSKGYIQSAKTFSGETPRLLKRFGALGISSRRAASSFRSTPERKSDSLRSGPGSMGFFSGASSFLSRSSDSFRAQRDQPSITSPIAPIADIGTIQQDGSFNLMPTPDARHGALLKSVSETSTLS